MFRRAIPVLHVTSSTASEQYFCGGLRFKQRCAYRPDEPKTDPCYMGLERDGVVFHISSFLGDGVSGSVATFIVDDLDGLHADLAERQVAIDVEPTDQSWDGQSRDVRAGSRLE